LRGAVAALEELWRLDRSCGGLREYSVLRDDVVARRFEGLRAVLRIQIRICMDPHPGSASRIHIPNADSRCGFGFSYLKISAEFELLIRSSKLCEKI
jgi:hypothetical protein